MITFYKFASLLLPADFVCGLAALIRLSALFIYTITDAVSERKFGIFGTFMGILSRVAKRNHSYISATVAQCKDDK